MANTGIPEKNKTWQITSINYRYMYSLQYSQGQRVLLKNHLLIIFSQMTRWHEPSQKAKASTFFHFPNIIFFIRFHIIMQGYRKTEMVGTRAKTDTMDFFGKQTFSSWFLRKDRWRWWYIWKIYPNSILTYPVASWHSSKLWYISPPFDAILSLVWFDTNKVAVFITWVEKS